VLIVVRHGRTAANAAGLLQGRVDNPLDEEGRRQAEAIARAVGPVDRVVTSPLRRARETAAAFGVEAEVDEAWIELAYGEWEERPVRDVPAATWAQWRRDDHFAPPGGESLASLQRRVEAACVALAEEALERDVVVVTHVSPIKAAVAWALGVGPSTSWRMNVAQASVHRLRTGAPIPAVLVFNDTSHLS
jgi:broad specificity phosphatase PhoE